ncbi:MAG: hypothetical protein V4735_00350 [Pseudomonadota bacterium]
MSSREITSDITKLAAEQDMTFGFSGKGNTTIEMVGCKDPAVKTYLSEFVSSMGQTANVAKDVGLGAVMATAASACALGTVDPTAAFMGAAAGVFASYSRGSKGHGKG